MKQNEIDAIFEEAKKDVSVACNDYHAHDSRCLAGDHKSIIICKLVEHINLLTESICKCAKVLEK